MTEVYCRQCVSVSAAASLRECITVLKKFEGEQVLLDRYHTTGNDTEEHKATYDAITDRLGTVIYDEKCEIR